MSWRFKISVPESPKNLHKINSKICGVPMACPTPSSLSPEQTICHKIAARPKHLRRACEPFVPAAHLQESRGPPGRKPRKSRNQVFPGLSPPESQKSSEKVEKYPKSLQKVSFWGLFDLFGTFLRLWAGRPGKTFLRLFRGFRPGGPRDSCRWAAGTQCEPPFWHLGAPRPAFICSKLFQ